VQTTDAIISLMYAVFTCMSNASQC